MFVGSPSLPLPVCLYFSFTICQKVADRQAVGGIPSLHLFSGGREILRIPVNKSESVESLGKRIDEVAHRVCQAGEIL